MSSIHLASNPKTPRWFVSILLGDGQNNSRAIKAEAGHCKKSPEEPHNETESTPKSTRISKNLE
jgi:hypothetical protein